MLKYNTTTGVIQEKYLNILYNGLTLTPFENVYLTVALYQKLFEMF